MIRFLKYDMKRYFGNKKIIILYMVAPILVMLLFTSIVAPLLFTAEITKFNIAIYNEDKSEPVNIFIDQLVNSKALKDLVVAYPTNSIKDGLAMVAAKEVVVFIHVPKNLFNNIRKQKESYVNLYSTHGHQLETTLIKMTLNSSLETVGKGQNLIEASKQLLIKKGINLQESEAFIAKATDDAIVDFMHRREILGEKGTISPIGGYLPIEYYMGAIFTVFAGLTMIPLVHITTRDISGSIYQRGLLSGYGTSYFYFARILSGFLLTSLVLSMVFPTGFLSKVLNMALNVNFSNSFAALSLSVCMIALFFSALALVIAIWIPMEEAALWVTFYLVLIMSIFSGALIPEGHLPNLIRVVGRLTPMRYAMRMITGALFAFNGKQFLQDLVKLSIWNIALLILGFLKIIKKGNLL